ncbi:hypothetical protein OH76DRAFT_1452815 [Lentinus brumalis]|uniref:Uncharacterized protein n=1 Tax=Lentinus brumalis TaxID=2498619 RepID=A0A371DRI8_9APHY|nr:hypothetical protein OH76DRAFT_1452815 [Polyporus brumalis]
MDTPEQLQDQATRPQEPASSPLSNRSREPTDGSSAYTHDQPDFSFDSGTSADKSMTTTTRTYEMEQISLNRPTALVNKQPTSRVVSLPEATPKFRMKQILERKTVRIVSMPLTTSKRFDTSSDSLDVSGDIFVSEDEERPRVRVRSQATDVPHTPSAPSSPDSIVIIANNSNQLSTDFLRQQTIEESPPDSDDEEWIVWAQSPPRPIPALHGPLSLPYARCPSGAEGTIIEEPDSIPRVIWGLQSSETTGARHSIKSLTAQTSTQKPSAPISNQSTRPLTRTKPDPKPAKPVLNARPGAVMSTAPPPQISQNASMAGQRPGPVPQPSPAPPEFILKHSEPIDLGRLMASAVNSTHPDYYTSQNTGWQTPFYHGMPTPELVHDLSPELQAMLFAQERLKSHGLSTSTQSGSLSASSSSASLLDALKSSRSPIVIEELASQYSSGSPAFAMSALDIAQKYRQQQYQQNLLPTPPNSSSPIWSSSFSPSSLSPYQGGLLSPELLAAAGLSHFNPNVLSSQSVPSRLEGTQQASRRPFGNTGVDGRNANLNRLAPAANINPIAPQQLPPRLAAEYTRRRALPELSHHLEPLQPGLAHQLPRSTQDVSGSPTMPRAPPNTPHGTSTSSYGLRRLDAAGQPWTMAPAVSQSSSRDAPAHGLPQHMRSIPLNRLAQRRLSTVPEEDYASSVDGRTVSGQARTNARGSTGATGLHLFLSPSGRANANAASLGLLGDTFGTRYGMDDMGVSAEKTRAVPSVKLPGVPGQAHGPVALSEATLVKEASRRQGSSNINNDGGRRGENNRGRDSKRGGRGRKGRGAAPRWHGAERVDGGMVVKS